MFSSLFQTQDNNKSTNLPGDGFLSPSKQPWHPYRISPHFPKIGISHHKRRLSPNLNSLELGGSAAQKHPDLNIS